MKGLVLSGWEGTRRRPITFTRAKQRLRASRRIIKTHPFTYGHGGQPLGRRGLLDRRGVPGQADQLPDPVDESKGSKPVWGIGVEGREGGPPRGEAQGDRSR